MHAMIKSLIICCLLKDYCLPIFVSHYQIILFTDLCFFENVRVNFRFASLRHSVTKKKKKKKKKKIVNLRFASPTFASPNLASLTFASPTFALPNEQSPAWCPLCRIQGYQSVGKAEDLIRVEKHGYYKKTTTSYMNHNV